MTISEKVAYLKGLAEGLGLDTKKREDKLFAAIIDILEDVALDIEDIEENALDLGEEIDELSDDLEELEDYVYDELDDDYDDEDDDNDDFCCGGSHHRGHGHGCGQRRGHHHGYHHHHEDDECGCGCDDDDDDEPIFFELKCPECENEITIDEDVFALGVISCPNCGELLEFDLDDVNVDIDEDIDGIDDSRPTLIEIKEEEED